MLISSLLANIPLTPEQMGLDCVGSHICRSFPINTYYSAKQFAVGWIKRCIPQIRKAHYEVIYAFPTMQRISAPNPLTVQESIILWILKILKSWLKHTFGNQHIRNCYLYCKLSLLLHWDSYIYFHITLYVLMMSESQS